MTPLAAREPYREAAAASLITVTFSISDGFSVLIILVWKNCETFQPLKQKYHVKELLDSEIDEATDIEVIGFDECFDFRNYYG